MRLTASHDGLLRVDATGLQEINNVGSVSVYTLFDGQPVKQGDTVAEAKVTPLVVPLSDVQSVENIAQTPPIKVLPFKPMRTAVVVRERMSQSQAQRMIEGLSAKLAHYGSTILETRYVSMDAESETIAATMRELLQGGADMLLATGGSTINPFDSLLNALQHVPASITRIGIPAHPGSMLWLAYAGHMPIVGVPSCGLFARATSFDLVLPQLLTGEELTSDHLASIGHGGLLGANDPRFPSYSGNPHLAFHNQNLLICNYNLTLQEVTQPLRFRFNTLPHRSRE